MSRGLSFPLRNKHCCFRYFPVLGGERVHVFITGSSLPGDLLALGDMIRRLEDEEQQDILTGLNSWTKDYKSYYRRNFLDDGKEEEDDDGGTFVREGRLADVDTFHARLRQSLPGQLDPLLLLLSYFYSPCRFRLLH